MTDNAFLKNFYEQHPEFKDKSLNEIKRQMEQLELVLEDKKRQEEEKKAKELQETIAAVRVEYDAEFERRKEAWVDDMKWFIRHDLIKPEVVALFTSSNGAVVPTNLLKRGFPADFVPPELVDTVPEFAAKISKMGSAKKEYAPAPISASGETFSDAVLRILRSYNGKPQSVETIRGNVMEDEIFKRDIEKNKRRLIVTLNGLARRKLAAKTEDGMYVSV